jgi:hypothetical protein
MEQKFLITNEEGRVQRLLDEGWIVISITQQVVSAGGGHLIGKFAVLLERKK